MTYSYVLLEAVALASRRLGWNAVARLIDEISPVIDVQMVTEILHQTALEAFRSARSRNISLVDQTSFALMRHLGLDHAFAFDADFEREGFALLAD